MLRTDVNLKNNEKYFSAQLRVLRVLIVDKTMKNSLQIHLLLHTRQQPVHRFHDIFQSRRPRIYPRINRKKTCHSFIGIQGVSISITLHMRKEEYKIEMHG